MSDSKLTYLIVACIALVLGIASFFWRRSAVKKFIAIEEPTKKDKRKKKIPTIALVICCWLFLVELLTFLFGKEQGEEFTVELFAQRVHIFGIELSSTVLLTWAGMAVLIILAVLARIFVVPKMTDKPKGVQNFLEILVGGISDYASDKGGHLGDGLSSYLFSLAALMLVCAFIELFGVRSPTADITMTFAMALITFFLINYYGIKRKGVKGRLNSLASPTKIVFPMKIISDIAVPVSLACRLFGNMLGGMIVMDLLYSALGNFGLFIPSVVGLYFNVFHPLIQAFIFITLSLTFINEAVE